MVARFVGAAAAALLAPSGGTEPASNPDRSFRSSPGLAPATGASTPATPARTSTSPAAGPSIVSALVRGVDVVRKQFRAPAAREGHVHFLLDVEVLPTTHARPATGTYRSVSATICT